MRLQEVALCLDLCLACGLSAIAHLERVVETKGAAHGSWLGVEDRLVDDLFPISIWEDLEELLDDVVSALHCDDRVGNDATKVEVDAGLVQRLLVWLGWQKVWFARGHVALGSGLVEEMVDQGTGEAGSVEEGVVIHGVGCLEIKVEVHLVKVIHGLDEEPLVPARILVEELLQEGLVAPNGQIPLAAVGSDEMEGALFSFWPAPLAHVLNQPLGLLVLTKVAVMSLVLVQERHEGAIIAAEPRPRGLVPRVELHKGHRRSL